MENKTIVISPLAHTWVLDFDGTLVVHNGYKHGTDRWLPGALDFLRSIPQGDYILIVTAREAAARRQTEDFIRAFGVRYDDIKFEMPMGERILVNDNKPSGLCCAYSIAVSRNQGLEGVRVRIDENL